MSTGKRVVLALVLGCLAAVAVVIGAWVVLPTALACGDAEEREFVAVVHPDGRELEPEGHADADSCSAMFETSQSVESVVDHYERELSNAGWTVQVIDQSGADSRGDRISSFDVTARSGEMYFIVYARSYPDSDVTHVTVHASDA